MSNRRNGRFRFAWVVAGSCLLTAGGFVGPACSRDERVQEAPELGQIMLDLTATGASGAEYRLRNGVFEITPFSGGETIVVSTEDDPTATRIEIDLPPDAYSVFLLPGYFLEKTSEPDGGAGGAGGANGQSVTQMTRLSDLLERRARSPERKLRWRPAPEPRQAPRAELPHPVDAELVSENPAFVQVLSGERSEVNFVFALEGGTGDDGELSIGIDVIEPGDEGCQPDDYEPNNSPEEAPLVTFDPPVEATACEFDDDFYLFDSPVATGDAFRVLVEFQHSIGDVDAFLINQEGSLVAAGTSVTDNEELVTVSDGGQYLLYVYTFSTDNSYTVSVAATDIELSNCCTVSPFPTCTDSEVNDCVCALDPFCCEVAFDELCVEEALFDCNGSCPGGQGSCCETSEEPGCEDAEVQGCVCGIDLFCCIDSYDEVCVEEAISACNLQCEVPDPDSDCCTVGEFPSCTDTAVAECTCAIDPSCCAAPFDENCVSIADGFCEANCGGL